jgi:hypothetical protein
MGPANVTRPLMVPPFRTSTTSYAKVGAEKHHRWTTRRVRRIRRIMGAPSLSRKIPYDASLRITSCVLEEVRLVSTPRAGPLSPSFSRRSRSVSRPGMRHGLAAAEGASLDSPPPIPTFPLAGGKGTGGRRLQNSDARPSCGRPKDGRLSSDMYSREVRADVPAASEICEIFVDTTARPH